MTKQIKMLAGTLFGLPLGAIFGIWLGFTVNIWVGIAAFVVMFLLSGWGFLTLAIKLAKKRSGRYEEWREEVAKTATLVLDGLANHEIAGHLYLGRLFLTTEALHYVGKHKGGEETKFQLPLKEIASMSSYKPNEYVNSGLQLQMKDGRVLRFVVEYVDEWLETIKLPTPVQPDSDPTP